MYLSLNKITFRKSLLDWYQNNARDLPWRNTRDPYAIWVSEIMLQQTRVETVIPYYKRWMDRFPTLIDLARADEDQVLSIWEGLGYYRRVSNFHRAVKEVVEKYQAQVPQNLELLIQLPGIGRYTAGAISSIAFDLPAPILDGNLRRVFSRYFNLNMPLGTASSEKILWGIAAELVPEQNSGDFNQALMELGALICLPRNPLCQQCPIESDCSANQNGTQNSLPVRNKTGPLPHIQVAAAVCQVDDRVLIAKRPLGGLLGGMWEFPGGKQSGTETIQETLQREIKEELSAEVEVGKLLGVYHHAYTHYKLTLSAFHCRLLVPNLVLNYHTEYSWVPLSDLERFPMGKIDRLISRDLRSDPT